MSPQRWDRCKQLFIDALDLADEERSAFSERECGADPELRLQVEKMLAAAADPSPLDVGAAERVVDNLRPAEPLLTGDVVGRYRVLKNIGQGGTSVVYLAEHVGLRSRRRFAIKVIASAALAGQQDRFQRECEILATLEHPNIARILDKGVTESGWPYLVMDHIDGTPIHHHCIDKKLAPPEIVRLMIECCRAAKYIHENLIIHCDLKPTNILVDATGSPRILDFGIALLIDPGANSRCGQTTRGIRPLTPDYASPEQLAGGSLNSSSDIYSLGVVLYECLARRLPFDTSELPWTEIGAKIAAQSPPPPSKARSSGSSAGEDATFAGQLRGDLDGIVLKTLAHDRAKRYASMDDLIADLTRYLAGEAVTARRSSLADRFGKLLRWRHRVPGKALAVGLSLALAFGSSSLYAQLRQPDQDNRHLEGLKAIVRGTPRLPQELRHSARARGTLAERFSNAIKIIAPRGARNPELVPDLAGAPVRTGDLFGNACRVRGVIALLGGGYGDLVPYQTGRRSEGHLPKCGGVGRDGHRGWIGARDVVLNRAGSVRAGESLKSDFVTGTTQRIMNDEILGAPRALVSIDDRLGPAPTYMSLPTYSGNSRAGRRRARRLFSRIGGFSCDTIWSHKSA